MNCAREPVSLVFRVVHRPQHIEEAPPPPKEWSEEFSRLIGLDSLVLGKMPPTYRRCPAAHCPSLHVSRALALLPIRASKRGHLSSSRLPGKAELPVGPLLYLAVDSVIRVLLPLPSQRQSHRPLPSLLWTTHTPLRLLRAIHPIPNIYPAKLLHTRNGCPMTNSAAGSLRARFGSMKS